MSDLRTYWDGQFRFSSILPDFEEWLQHYEKESADFSRSQSHAEVSYGPDPRQIVEIWGSPAASRLLPVFVHGGYWRALTAERHRFVIRELIQHYGAAANVEYRLMPHIRMQDQISDVRRSLAAIAGETGCDLILIGHSAGSHLAIEATLAGGEYRVVAFVGISGIYDLSPIQFSFLQDELRLTPEEVRRHSPLVKVGNCHVPITLVVGELETPEFHRQSRMVQAVTGSVFHLVKNAHHMSVCGNFVSEVREIVAVSTG